MKRFITLAIFLISILCTNVWAEATNLSDWNFYRDIKIQGENRYKYLFLDGDIYKNSKSDLSDIRIVDESGQFVPYFLNSQTIESQSSEIVHDSKIISKFKKQYDSYFDFKIEPKNQNTDVIGNKLIVFTDSNNFLKSVDVYGSYDSLSWDFLQTQDIYHVNNIQKFDIQLNNTYKYDFYRVKIKNNIENIVLSGLQLIDESLIITKDDVTREAQAVYEVKNESKTTLININNDSRLKILSLDLSVDGNFSRRYEVLYKQNGSYISTGYMGDLYNFEYKNQKLRNTNIDFNYPLNNNSIQIKINNLDDRPLDIKSIQLKYRVDKLIFENLNNKPYKIYFGNDKVQLPEYDILKYKQYIEKEKQDLCELSNIIGKNEKIPMSVNFNVKNAYNIILISISALLIVVILLKLKVTNKQKNEP